MLHPTLIAAEQHGDSCVRPIPSSPTAPRPTPTAGAMFPEVVTWTDGEIVVAIELAKQRDPSMKLGAPIFFDQMVGECSAELVRRRESQDVNPAA